MPMWRCPHCATPQAETGRCWVCHRSTTACGACRNFRRSVAGQLGYCGIDRQRRPLQGDEIRSCWEAADATVASPTPLPGVGAAWPLEPDADGTDVRALRFIEVQPGAPPEGVPEPIFLATTGGEARWSLWGDVEA